MRLDLTLKTITPLLMNRLADNPRSDERARQLKNAPQLRSASFRGVFRYWLRAILGHVIDESDLPAYEARIFGSTQTASAIKIVVGRLPKAQKDLFVLPTTVKLKNGNRIPYEQYGFPSDLSFDISLQTHPLIDQLPELLVETVELALLLGGFGRRSRRLGGNLQVTHVNGEARPVVSGENPGAFIEKQVTHALVKAVTLTGNAPRLPATRPNFPCFATGYYSILIADACTDIMDAYDVLWRASGPYHYNKGAYGSPSPRRASSVHMKLLQSDKGYHPIMTIFESGEDRDWRAMQGFVAHIQTEGFSKIL